MHRQITNTKKEKIMQEDQNIPHRALMVEVKITFFQEGEDKPHIALMVEVESKKNWSKIIEH